MVELKEEELPFLIGKWWALQDRLRSEIDETSSGLCRWCRVGGQYVVVSKNKASHIHNNEEKEKEKEKEKERLAGIRDSIRDVGHMLCSLQKLGARQRRCREGLEESRARLMELVRQHHFQATRKSAPHHLVREIEASNDDCGSRSIWNWRSTFIALCLGSISALLMGKTRLRLEAGANHTLDIFHGRG